MDNNKLDADNQQLAQEITAGHSDPVTVPVVPMAAPPEGATRHSEDEVNATVASKYDMEERSRADAEGKVHKWLRAVPKPTQDQQVMAAQPTQDKMATEPSWGGVAPSAPVLAQAVVNQPEFTAALKPGDFGQMANLESSIGADKDPSAFQYLTDRWLKTPKDFLLDTPVEGLKALADAVTQPSRDFGQGAQEGELEGRLAQLRTKEVLGTATPAELLRADALSKSTSTAPHSALDVPYQSGKMAGGMIAGADTILSYTLAGAGAGAVIGALPSAGLGAAPGALAGAGLGFTAGMGAQGVEQGIGATYEALKNMTLPDGSAIDPNVAKGAALVVGAINGGMGMLPLVGIMSKGGLVQKLTGPGQQALLRQLASSPATAAVLARLAVKFTAASGAQALIGGLQELVTVAGEQFVSGGKAPTNLLTRLPIAMATAASAGAGFSALEAGTHQGFDPRAEIGRTAQALTHFENMGQTARDVQMFSKDSSKAKDYFDRIAKVNELKSVTFPRRVLAAFFDKEGYSSDSLKAVMPDVHAQLDATAGDPAAEIRVNPGDVGAYLAKSKNFSMLHSDMRYGSGWTLNEAAEAMKASKKAAAAPAMEVPPEQKKIYDEVRGQLKNTFGSTAVADEAAKFHMSAVASLAEAQGISFKEAHDSLGLEFVRKMAAELDERQNGIPGARMDEVPGKYRILDTSEKIPAMEAAANNLLTEARKQADAAAADAASAGVTVERNPSHGKGTWGELFDTLSDRMGDTKAQEVFARYLGADGLKAGPTNIVWHPDVYIPRTSPLEVKGRTTFAEGKTTVAFGPKADPGTIIHELAHVYLRAHEKAMGAAQERQAARDASPFEVEDPNGVLQPEKPPPGQGATNPGKGQATVERPTTPTPEQAAELKSTQQKLREKNDAAVAFDKRLLENWEKVRTAIGAAPGETLTTDHEEKFAELVVNTLRSSKAPTPALERTFSRFKGWMNSVYGAQLDTGMAVSPETAHVMGRLLASEKAINAARDNLISPAFKDAKAAGMTETAFEAYKRQLEDASATAQSALERESFSTISDEQIHKMEETKNQVRDELVAAKPEFSVRSYIQDGERLDHGPLPLAEERKMSTSDLQALGASPADLMQLRGLHSAEGSSVEDMARAFKFQDGRAMLDALLETPELERAVSSEAQNRTPGWVDPEKYLQNRAFEKMSNGVVQTFLGAELRAMGGTTVPTADMLKSAAEGQIRDMPVSSLDPTQMLVEYHRLGQAAQEAHETGGAEAPKLKLRQMVQFEMWRAARTALETKANFSATMDRLGNDPVSRARLERADPKNLEAIDAARYAYGFSQERQDFPIGDFVQDANNHNGDIRVDPALRARETAPHNADDMTVQELRAAKDFMASLEHHILQVDEYRGGATPKILDPLVGLIAEHIKLNGPKLDRTGAMEGLFSKARSLGAGIERAEFLLRFLDADDPHGFLNQTIFQPLVEAEGRKTRMMNAMHEAVGGLLESLGNERDSFSKVTDFRVREKGDAIDPMSGKYPMKDGRALTKGEILTMLLNWGNEHNRNSFREGYGVTDAEVMKAFKDHITPKMGAFANGIWRTMDAIFPDVSSAYEQRTGVGLEGTRASAFKIGDIEMEGGHFPIKYSNEAVNLHQLRFKSDDFNTMDINDQFTKARSESKGPIELGLGTVLGNLGAKIHFATMYNAVQEANKIISHPEFIKSINGAVGPEFNKVLSDMLNNTARDGMPAQAMSTWDRAQRWLMSGTTQAALGLNVKTALLRGTGLIPTLGDVNPKHTAMALANVLSDFKGTFERANAQSNEFPRMSGELENASDVWKLLMPDVTLHESVESQIRSLGDGKLFASAKAAQDYMSQVGMSHIAATQKFVNLLTWEGARLQGVSEGRVDPVAFADAVLRQTHGGTGLKDLPNILAQPGMARGVTQFYSYLSVVAAKAINGGLAFSGGARGGTLLTTKTLMQTVVPLATYFLLPNTINYLANQKYKDKPADASEAGWFLRAQLGMSASRIIPVVGDAIGTAIAPDAGGHGGPGGALGQLSAPVRNLASAVLNPDKHPLAHPLLGDVAKLSSMLFTIPTNHFYQGTDFAIHAMRGDYGNDAFNVFIRGAKKEGQIK